MVDIFLMGTVGSSNWRESFKAACIPLGIHYFDPVVPVWNEEAGKREVAALRSAKIVVMAILPESASIASLAESGWVALSALKRKQSFGLYIDPAVELGSDAVSDSMEEASTRARKLVVGHAAALKAQYPRLNLYLAPSLQELEKWAIQTTQRLNGHKQRKKAATSKRHKTSKTSAARKSNRPRQGK